jgi:GNAT superfamily N-acetyltransferase
VATATSSPERWARFLDQHAPGLTWLAGTLLEWGELPPLARRAWSVTASTTRSGEVNALAAFHEESGLLAVAGTPDAQPPFYADPNGVRRILGLPEAVESVFVASPMLIVRRMPGFSRQVLTFDGDGAIRHPMLRRAKPNEWEALEQFRVESDVDREPEALVDLAGPAQRGLVYVLEGDSGIAGMFRVEGVSRQRVQFADAFVHPRFRGRGLGSALLRSAAHVARSEYARGSVLTMAHTAAGEKTGARAGYAAVGFMDDVRLS